MDKLISDYEVKTTSETRAELTKILAVFRKQGKKALPVLFGSHRKPEAVLLPAKLWQKILHEVGELEFANELLQRMSNTQVIEAVTYQQFHEEMQALKNDTANSKDANGEPRKDVQ